MDFRDGSTMIEGTIGNIMRGGGRKLFHAWLDYFTLITLGVTEVYDLRVLLFLMDIIIHSGSNFNGRSSEASLKVTYGTVTPSHGLMWIMLPSWHLYTLCERIQPVTDESPSQTTSISELWLNVSLKKLLRLQSSCRCFEKGLRPYDIIVVTKR